VGDTQYIFKHALTQEAAYNSLVIERRKLLHERAGAALEMLGAKNIWNWHLQGDWQLALTARSKLG